MINFEILSLRKWRKCNNLKWLRVIYLGTQSVFMVRICFCIWKGNTWFLNKGVNTPLSLQYHQNHHNGDEVNNEVTKHNGRISITFPLIRLWEWQVKLDWNDRSIDSRTSLLSLKLTMNTVKKPYIFTMLAKQHTTYTMLKRRHMMK